MVAASSKLYKSGLRSASKVVCALNADNTAGKKIKRSLDTHVKLPSPYSPAEAQYIDLNHTKHKYKLMRCSAKQRDADIYPSYQKLHSANVCATQMR